MHEQLFIVTHDVAGSNRRQYKNCEQTASAGFCSANVFVSWLVPKAEDFWTVFQINPHSGK